MGSAPFGRRSSYPANHSGGQYPSCYPPRTSPSPGCRVRGWRARHSLQVRSRRHSSGERGIGEQGGTPQPNLEGRRLAQSHASRTHTLSPEHGPAETCPTPRPKLHFRSRSAPSLGGTWAHVYLSLEPETLPTVPCPLILPKTVSFSHTLLCPSVPHKHPRNLSARASNSSFLSPTPTPPQHRSIIPWKCMDF